MESNMAASVARTPQVIPPVNPFEQRFLQDAGVQNKNLAERWFTSWIPEAGDNEKVVGAIVALALGALFIPILGVGSLCSVSLITGGYFGYDAYTTYKQNQKNKLGSFSALVDQYVGGHASPSVTAPLFKRIVALGVADSDEDSKASLAAAKQLIGKALIVKKVPPKIRSQVEKDFQPNISKVVALSLAKRILEPVALQLTQQQSEITATSIILRDAAGKKRRIQNLVNKGYFVSPAEALKEIAKAMEIPAVSQVFNNQFKAWGIPAKMVTTQLPR